MHDTEEIYALYPRKVAKRAAIKSISFALTRLHDGEAGQAMSWASAGILLIEATAKFAQSFAGTRGTYTPHPTTWFNQARYLDDPKEWEDHGQNNNSKAQQRFINNRKTVLQDLGYDLGEDADPSGDALQGGNHAGGITLVGKTPHRREG